MTQLKKYLWLIDTIRRHGAISHKALSDEWDRNKDLSDYKPLHRGTFNRWRTAIYNKFGVKIECRASGGYLYYISNPEEIDDNQLKHWILDTFSIGNIVDDNIALKDRILVEEIPSGRHFLTPVIQAMKGNYVVEMQYHSFRTGEIYTVSAEPFCIKLFEGRWYMLARPVGERNPILYGLDRIESLSIRNDTFKLPKDFSAVEYFDTLYGIVAENVKPAKIILRAHAQHKYYLRSLPLHHSQRLLKDCGDYADFELFVAPTFDFIMRLLHDGAWLEVISPAFLRQAMKGWISDMADLYEDD